MNKEKETSTQVWASPGFSPLQFDIVSGNVGFRIERQGHDATESSDVSGYTSMVTVPDRVLLG